MCDRASEKRDGAAGLVGLCATEQTRLRQQDESHRAGHSSNVESTEASMLKVPKPSADRAMQASPELAAAGPDTAHLIERRVAGRAVLVEQRVRIVRLPPELHDLEAAAVRVVVEGGVRNAGQPRHDLLHVLAHLHAQLVSDHK